MIYKYRSMACDGGTIPLAVGGTVKAQIWDTAGQERYRAITSGALSLKSIHFDRFEGKIDENHESFRWTSMGIDEFRRYFVDFGPKRG